MGPVWVPVSPTPESVGFRVYSPGRLIDSANNDLELDGYITFYALDRDGDNESPGRILGLREYRARFLSGQLQNIVRVNEEIADRVRYGLASFRWFHTPSFLFDDSDDESDASKADVGIGK